VNLFNREPLQPDFQEATMAATYRRRNYFTKKGFQTRFILHFLAASIVANILTVSLFIVLARHKIDSLLFSMRLPHTSAGALLSPAAFTASIASVVVVSLLFLWAARGMYRKIDAPLHRIRTDLHKVESGDLRAEVILRDEDEFKDFAGEVNAMVGELNRRFTGLKGRTDELAKAAKTLRTSPTVAESQALRQNMMQTISSLEEQLKAFKL
jgi:methyl-accepting chemotaxis protein